MNLKRHPKFEPANKKVTVGYDEAARMADQWLSQGLTKGEVKNRLSNKFGACARTLEMIISRARQIALSRKGLDAIELRQRSHDVYQSIISDLKVPPSVKVVAQKRLDKLYGLEAPAQVKLSGSLDVGVTQEDATKLLGDEETAKLLDLVADRMARAKELSEN